MLALLEPFVFSSVCSDISFTTLLSFSTDSACSVAPSAKDMLDSDICLAPSDTCSAEDIISFVSILRFLTIELTDFCICLKLPKYSLSMETSKFL